MFTPVSPTLITPLQQVSPPPATGRPVLYAFTGPARYLNAQLVKGLLTGWQAVGIAVFPGQIFVSVGQWTAAAEHTLPDTAEAIAARVRFRNWSGYAPF